MYSYFDSKDFIYLKNDDCMYSYFDKLVLTMCIVTKKVINRSLKYYKYNKHIRGILILKTIIKHFKF